MKITKEDFENSLSEMAQSSVTYPKKDHWEYEVSAPLIDWFDHNAQDAMDFGVLKEPKFDGYSDIAIMQKEWYVEELLRDPFMNALKKLNIEVML